MGFVGFGGLQGSPGASNLGYVPMSTGVSEDVDASVDGEFRMVMRKLMKRDSVTKLKVNCIIPQLFTVNSHCTCTRIQK